MAIQSREITSSQKIQLEKARGLTEAQIEMAEEIAKQYSAIDNDLFIATITQVLATNYATITNTK